MDDPDGVWLDARGSDGACVDNRGYDGDRDDVEGCGGVEENVRDDVGGYGGANNEAESCVVSEASLLKSVVPIFLRCFFPIHGYIFL